MGDVAEDKKQKLANTRKRFKELQELKKKRNDCTKAGNLNPDSAQSSSRNTPSDLRPPQEDSIGNATVSPISSAPEESPDGSQQNYASESVPSSIQYVEQDEESALPSDYGSSNYQAPATFFDSISPTNDAEKQSDHTSPSLLTYFNTRDEKPTENIGLPRYFDNLNSSAVIWENTIPENKNSCQEGYQLFPSPDQISHNSPDEVAATDDVLSDIDPELKKSEQEMSELAQARADQLKFGPFPEAQSGDNNLDNIFSPQSSQKLLDYLGSTGATEEERSSICHTNQEIDSSADLTKKEIQYSNVEGLKQLSEQLAQMMEPDYDNYSSGSITDLEKRNIELAAHLDQERLQSEQLRAANSQLEARVAQLEEDLSRMELGSELQSAQQTMQMKSELQTHLQTIGLLVAEKTELSSNLSQYEISCKQKITECEELQARLRASRTRVADLERELAGLKSDKVKFESAGEQYGASLEALKLEYAALKTQKEELAQDLLEAREKLKNALEENLQLQQSNKDLAGKQSLAEVKIQQLSSGGTAGMDHQLAQLTQEKFALQSEIASLNQSLKSIIKERDESTVQYQQYAQQLNAQISSLGSKLEQLQQERETLVLQDQSRISHIGTLEKQLQVLQNDQITFATRNSHSADVRHDLDKSREMCVQLQIEKTSAEENYTRVSNENKLLMKELEAKTDSIAQLESMIEQLRGNQPDSVKLLAAMESDKVAASRAIQQNKELKQQLESMQEVFRKMDDDKVELTENLKGQQQANKDLLEKLVKAEATMQSLAEAIDIKDVELTRLREACEDLKKHAMQHEQREDRLRHYEAHDNSAHILQQELLEAKQTIARLALDRQPEPKRENGDVEQANTAFSKEVDKLNAMAQEAIDNIEQAEGDTVLNQENVMKHLEEKVKRTMQEIADLTDEKQRLEHIVTQLQGETETIGEYVALYQRQRMVLKQRALEKDQQLKQLAGDREQVKLKLDKLNELIKQLVTEKGSLPAELLQHQESMNSQIGNFCEEHSKMNEDINKIKITNVSNVSQTSHTAEEIITLLSEIKTSNLVEPDENFHHCPWCSGQLMTV
uniref:Golgin subfamily A conserved domain-containing protein n=1 Tax=Dendroctonus ponderosae TaxID=77166 RepID=A0AAR5PGQ6_DENPD